MSVGHPRPRRERAHAAFCAWGGERCPRAPDTQSGPRGAPGGTVGTTTGRPQGLSPQPAESGKAGCELAGRRRENRRGGRSASALSFRGVTARHSPGARHPLATRGEERRKRPRRATPDRDRTRRRDREARMLIARCLGRAGTRTLATYRSLPRRREPRRGFALRSSWVLRFRPGCPAGAGHERTDVCCEGAPHAPSSFRRRPESSTRGPTVVMAGLVPAMPVVREWWLPPT